MHLSVRHSCVFSIIFVKCAGGISVTRNREKVGANADLVELVEETVLFSPGPSSSPQVRSAGRHESAGRDTTWCK